MNNYQKNTIKTAVESINLAIQAITTAVGAINEVLDDEAIVLNISPDSKMVEMKISKKTGKVVGKRGRRRSSDPDPDPVAVKRGAKGGLAGAGVPKTKTVRSPYGSVGFKNMSQQEKREYWRRTKSRAAERKAKKSV